jgi:cytochrome oxidase Cu insertion factor (SCO1/SenC/PrrC family)
MVAGACVFPISVSLMSWYENKKVVEPELAPDFQSMKSVKMEPRAQLGGPFRLRESRTGKYITDEELFKDKWTLLYFGFSKCAEICPNTLAYISQVMKACDEEYCNDADLANEEKKLQAVFLSIDFLRDKPEVVETFVRRYDPRVRGLCGTKQEVEIAARAWRVYYSSVDETDEEREAREAKGVDAPVVDDTYQFDHSSAIYLVGPDGKMKDFFFQVMGIDDTVSRIGIHMSDIYGFSDTRKK